MPLFSQHAVDRRRCSARAATRRLGSDAVSATSYAAFNYVSGAWLHAVGRPTAAVLPVNGDPMIAVPRVVLQAAANGGASMTAGHPGLVGLQRTAGLCQSAPTPGLPRTTAATRSNRAPSRAVADRHRGPAVAAGALLGPTRGAAAGRVGGASLCCQGLEQGCLCLCDVDMLVIPSNRGKADYRHNRLNVEYALRRAKRNHRDGIAAGMTGPWSSRQMRRI